MLDGVLVIDKSWERDESRLGDDVRSLREVVTVLGGGSGKPLFNKIFVMKVGILSGVGLDRC